jgi:M6 family metalloprotease-like protein
MSAFQAPVNKLDSGRSLVPTGGHMRTSGRPGGGVRLRFLVLAVLVATVSEAAFLRNVPQTVTQPDGTVLHLLATGDEYYNRLHDASGFTIVRDPETGYLVYAIRVDGRLEPSGLVVGRDDPAAAGLEKGVMPDPRYLPAPEELYPIARRHARVRALGVGNAPAFSLINDLVIFIRFADEADGGFQMSDTYQMWFNSTAANQSSMQKYFLEASYNLLTVSSTFYPPATGGAVTSYQDVHPRSYFKPYDATTNPDGYQDSERGAREWTLLQTAVNAVASQVPPTLDLDTNNDGYIDSVVFVVSGSAVSADWSNLLWPHRWQIDDTRYPTVVNGKQLGDYNLQLDGNILVGVLCHEMTHTLGAPDLYRYDTCSSDSNLEPVGQWDLMANDADPPQHTTAFLKWRYLGFIATIPLISTSGTYTLHPLTSATDNCYRITSPNTATEYFVVEYRKRSFPFENSLSGSGLLVYRIDTDADGQGDQCGPPDEVYVYRPGGTLTSNGNLRQANFAADATPSRTAIDDATDPSPFLSDGFPGGLSISNVGSAGDTISFQVTIQQACSKPSTFSLTSPVNGANVAGVTSATLTWGAANAANSYDVYFGTDPNPPLLGNQTATTVSVTVANNTSYFWRVAARNSCGQVFAPASGTWAFSVGGTGGVTLLSDDFEGQFPGKWKVYGVQGHAGGAMWGTVSCKTSGGSGAAWCAASGSEAQPPCTQYIQDQGTFLIFGPFDMSDAADGTLDFDTWYDINDGGDPETATDYLAWLFSTDGSSFSAGDGVTGTSNGWEHVSAKLSDLLFSDGTSAVGQPQVWLGFVFVSSPTTTPQGGAYIDNVVLKKVIGEPGPPPARVRRHLPRQ